MRHLYITVLSLCLALCVHAQLPANFNLVANPTLRQYPGTAGPLHDSDFDKADCWTPASWQVSYLNSSDKWVPKEGDDVTYTADSAFFPEFTGDYTLDHMGVYEYVRGLSSLSSPRGVFTYRRSDKALIDTPLAGDTESFYYAQNRLLEPLKAGTRYYFSMRIPALALSKPEMPVAPKPGYVGVWKIYVSRVKNIGVYFSKDVVANSGRERMKVRPQLNFTDWNTSKTDTVEFIKVSGSFIAAGGEQYMIIGNFDAHLDWKVWDANWIDGDVIPIYDYYSAFYNPQLVRDTSGGIADIAPFDLGPDQVICAGDSLLLTAPPYYPNYYWSTGDTARSIRVYTPGSYWCRSDAGCTHPADTVRVRAPKPVLPFDLPDTNICAALTFSGPEGYAAYQWSNGSTSAATVINQSGVYWLRISEPCNAAYTDTFHVIFCGPQIDSIRLSNDSICAGDCIAMQGYVEHDPDHYAWTCAGGDPTFLNNTASADVCYHSTGNYDIQLVVSNEHGADTAHRRVTVLDKPRLHFADTALTVPYEQLLSLLPCGAGAHIDWYKGDSLVCAGCAALMLTANNYRETYRCVISNGQCTDSCRYEVSVIDIPHELWLPNAFSPNGDGRNETFGIITNNPNIRVVDFSIYGRYGDRVYHAGNSNAPWDGTYKGRPEEPGSYYWQLTYKVEGSPDQYYKKGDLSLLR